MVGINPGPVGTDRHVTLMKTRAKNQLGDENRYKELQKGMPLGRPAHAREIGDLMAFLASDRSGYTSGVIFTVDGGIYVGMGVAVAPAFILMVRSASSRFSNHEATDGPSSFETRRRRRSSG